MFKWKKNASRDSIAHSKDSFAASRDSFVVTSPSAASATNSVPDTSGLFVQDYRDSRQPSQTNGSRDASAHAASVYTPTSSRSHSSSPEVVSKTNALESVGYQQLQSHPHSHSKPHQNSHSRSHSHSNTHKPSSFSAPVHNAPPPAAPAPPPAPAPVQTPISFAYLELETHNNAFEQNNRMLCARVHELKTKHSQLLSEIKCEEEEKSKFQEHVAVLRKRLGQVTHALEAQRELCSTVDKLIEETEDGYMKIVETSKTILQMLDNDYSQIYKRRSAAVENAFRE